MAVILAPIPPAKLDAWKSFIATCGGARKAEFEEFNRRNGLTKHEAWLAETPMGPIVVAIHEGPGAAEMMGKMAQSTNAFDKWFVSQLAEIHGMDLTKPPPGPMPECKLSWHA